MIYIFPLDSLFIVRGPNPPASRPKLLRSAAAALYGCAIKAFTPRAMPRRTAAAGERFARRTAPPEVECDFRAAHSPASACGSMAAERAALFAGFRALGRYSSHVPHVLRYHGRHREFYVATAVGRSVHTYNVSRTRPPR